MTNSQIRVVIRKRPLNHKELDRGDFDVVQVHSRQIIFKQLKQKLDLTTYTELHPFTFDAAFSETTSNQEIYEQEVRPLLVEGFGGVNVTFLAYGQTGSGKTYTILGKKPFVKGIYAKACQQVFKMMGKSDERMSVSVSFYQIYCAKIFDLLNDRKELFAREDAHNTVNIVGLLAQRCPTLEHLFELVDYGQFNRKNAHNNVNIADSSRSHAILELIIKVKGKQLTKISFIDLAGSERARDHGDESKQTRLDGAEINKSLLALKECIRAIDLGKNHRPFRGSKLTMVLKDSFIGNCRSLMIGNISASSFCCENSLNTLRYANRVKQLRNEKEAYPMTRGRQSEKGKVTMPTLFEEGRESLFEDSATSILHRQNQLIENILREEEEIIDSHKSHLEDSFQTIRQQMQIINDEHLSTQQEYRTALQPLLSMRLQSIHRLRAKALTLKRNLHEEKTIGAHLSHLNE